MKKNIVIIDDEIAMRGILEQFLAGDYATRSFNDAAAALAWLASNPLPDCLIADLNLPGMSGFELIENVRAGERTRALPIIVLSSKESSEVKIKCLRLGADDYLIKPFNPDELIARMESIFRRMSRL